MALATHAKGTDDYIVLPNNWAVYRYSVSRIWVKIKDSTPTYTMVIVAGSQILEFDFTVIGDMNVYLHDFGLEYS